MATPTVFVSCVVMVFYISLHDNDWPNQRDQKNFPIPMHSTSVEVHTELYCIHEVQVFGPAFAFEVVNKWNLCLLLIVTAS